MLLESLKPKGQENLGLGLHLGFFECRLINMILFCLSGILLIVKF